MALALFGLMALNFAISWFNAWSVGKTWAETSYHGGWPHIVNWSAAIMSASGFTWVYLALLALAAGAFGILDLTYVEAMLNLGYLIIILPVLGSGITLTVHSWTVAWRNRSFGSIGVAGWNTFAQIYNTARAVTLIPDALGKVIKAFSGGKKSKDSIQGLIAVLLIIISIGGGIMTTYAIVASTMRSHANGMMKKKNDWA